MGKNMPNTNNITDITPNQLNKTSYQFNCDRIKNVVYQCQTCNIPGLTVGIVEQQNMFTTIKRPENKVEFEDLSIEFLIDSELNNWIEIYNWLFNIGTPENFDQSGFNEDPDEYTDESDATLFILNNKKVPNLKLTFKGIFPTSLSAIEFETTTTTLEPIKATVTFAFDTYSIERIN